MSRGKRGTNPPDQSADTDPIVGALGATVATLWSQLATTREELATMRKELTIERGRAHALDSRVAVAERGLAAATSAAQAGRQAITTAMWAANAPLRSRPMVSVIIPTFTRARSELLRGAIESVLAQTYDNWELIVVDNSGDGMLEELPPWWPESDRVRVLTSPVRSSGAARNVALDAAAGELIAYLDDDCRWFPWWLHAVVVAFDAAPDSVFAHGVRFSGGRELEPVLVQAHELTQLLLHLNNYVDTNTFVHRADIGERWDTTLTSCTDYDLLIRLADQPHQFVPVPACTYAVGTPEQAWSSERHDQNLGHLADVRRRARRRRPLRIVAFNAMYPLLSETYIGDELEALRRFDADIVLARGAPGPTECPSRIDVPMFDSVKEAIEHHDPDLVLSHWGNTAKSVRDYAAQLGIPHAVRLHSMCEPIPDHEIFHDWCVGAWGPPSFPRDHPRSFVLPTLIVDPQPPGSDADRDRRIVSCSAGLPKKNWTMLVAASKAAGVTLDLAIGRTLGWEDQPNVVHDLVVDADLPGRVRTDVPYDECQRMLRTAGAMVYSLIPGEPTGQPRSVIEAALAAIPIVVPDTASLRQMLGDTAHYYDRTETDSLVAALDEALDRPHSEPERLALADRIRETHSDPDVFAGWADSLTRALVEWQASNGADRFSSTRHWWMGT